MKQEEGSKGKRRPYRKPRMEQVELRPEEAVLGGCKTDLGEPGPDTALCSDPQCLDLQIS